MTDLLADAVRSTVEYCRISRDRNGFAEGVESQHLDNEEAAEEIGETISHTYTDNDLSAFSGVERPAYQELLRDMEAGKIKLVIFWHAKRLHRSLEEALAFIKIARAHKVKLYSCSHGWYNLNRVQGRQTFTQHTLDGQTESEERGERVALARKRQARQGVFGGGVRPYGWGVDTGRIRSVCINPKAPPMERIYEDRSVLDMSKHRPDEAGEIQMWANKLLSGVPMNQILLDLNRRNVPTQAMADSRIMRRNGKVVDHGGWNSRTIKAILTSPRTSGHSVHHGEIMKENAYEAIIPEDTRQALINLFSDPTRRSAPGNTPRWLGSLIYECGVCDDGTTVRQRERNGRPCYVCTDHGHCLQPAEEIDRFVQELLIERLGRPDIADLLPTRSTVNTAALRAEAIEINAGTRTLAVKLALGKIKEAIYDAAMAEADKRLAEIAAALEEADPANSPIADFLVSDDARKTWKGKSLGQHREILKMLLHVKLVPVGRGVRHVETWQRVEISKATRLIA